MLRLIVKMERGEEEATWSTFDVTCPELEAMLGKAPLVIAGYEVRAGAPAAVEKSLADRMKEMRERNEAADKARMEKLAKEEKERKEKAAKEPKRGNGAEPRRWFGMF